MANEIQATQANGSNAVTVTNFCMSLSELKQRASMVSQIKREIMKENVHWGKVPGCGEKPTLLKNGAEMLCLAFGLASDVKTEITDLGNGHREYTVTTALMAGGALVATGIGSCSTMESKYRYRGNELTLIGDCPKDYWNKPRPAKYKGQTAKKDESTGKWMLYSKGAKTENPDIADVYNTCLKMASKRSLIDATLKATGGSCEFTQDLEDMKGNASASAGFDDYEVVDEEANASADVPSASHSAAPNEGAAKDEEKDRKAFVTSMAKLQKRLPGVYAETLGAQGYEKAEEVPADKRLLVYNVVYMAVKNNA